MSVSGQGQSNHFVYTNNPRDVAISNSLNNYMRNRTSQRSDQILGIGQIAPPNQKVQGGHATQAMFNRSGQANPRATVSGGFVGIKHHVASKKAS